LLLLAISLSIALPASAQGKKDKKAKKKEEEAQAAPKAKTQGKSLRIIVLKFETFKTSDDVMNIVYNSLNEAFKQAPGMSVSQNSEVTLNDLVITLGCDGATKECLSGLQDLIDADRIVFGSVQKDGDVYLFNIRVFDFAQGDFIARVEDQTIQGDNAKLKAAVPALVESIIYGNVGIVEVSVLGSDAPEVFFDGKKVGRAPLSLDSLPLGEHTIMVKNNKGEEQTQTVLLRKDTPAKVVFNFGDIAKIDDPDDSASSALLIPGWVAIGIGVAGTAFGIYNQLELGIQEEAAARFQGRTFVNSNEADDIRLRYDKMQSYHTNRIIGYTVGGIGLAAGITMLVMAYSDGETEGKTTSAALPTKKLPLQVSPAPQGVHVSFDWSF
jgi:F0F1-type ATP synthase membrane subunit c/vacuolar-type H+-ATPase subunit K